MARSKLHLNKASMIYPTSARSSAQVLACRSTTHVSVHISSVGIVQKANSSARHYK